jgi:hypothetical protein
LFNYSLHIHEHSPCSCHCSHWFSPASSAVITKPISGSQGTTHSPNPCLPNPTSLNVFSCMAHASILKTDVVKADSNITCRAHAVNSHMPCCAPALLRQCRVLRESLRGSRKYPNC